MDPDVPTRLLQIAELEPAQLTALLDLAAELRSEPFAHDHALHGRSVACFFEKPSTRTRVSFEAAAHRLGMLPIMLRPDELQLGRGETIEDTARTLGGYASAIVIRTFRQEVIERMAGAAGVPVINALSDDHHPCQALADLLTLRDHFGKLRGLKVAYLGDANNVAHSLMEAGALAGLQISIASPAGYDAHPEIAAAAAEVAAGTGGRVEVLEDPEAAVAGAHAVYTDVWVSMGQEADSERRLRALDAYRVTPALMSRAAAGAIFMHCLPAHRGEEVAAEVIDGPQTAVWDQARNRLPTEQAALVALVTGSWRPPA